jgi:hypothetical protein
MEVVRGAEHGARSLGLSPLSFQSFGMTSMRHLYSPGGSGSRLPSGRFPRFRGPSRPRRLSVSSVATLIASVLATMVVSGPLPASGQFDTPSTPLLPGTSPAGSTKTGAAKNGATKTGSATASGLKTGIPKAGVSKTGAAISGAAAGGLGGLGGLGGAKGPTRSGADLGGSAVPTLPENGVRLDEQRLQRWQFGVTIQSPGECTGMMATVPVPTSWPEQSVKLVSEDFSPNVRRVAYRVLEGGVRQMVVEIPKLRAGETATALITVEVNRAMLRPPLDPGIFRLPDIAKLPRDVRIYLAPSPLIEVSHPTIQKLAKEVWADQGEADAWTKVERIYDWVREHVEFFEGPIKGALAAYKDKRGDCEELSSLFIALCRANKIPARTVWVPDHCYPEFYLVDDMGVGHWIPCQAAGTRSFGGIPEFRPVLQKGDNFKVPERKDAVRYVPELVKAQSVTANPQVETIRQLLNE